jgi:hypothetical protein
MRIKFDKKKSNQIIRDKIEKQFQLRKKEKLKITIKRMRTKFDIKIKYQ